MSLNTFTLLLALVVACASSLPASALRIIPPRTSAFYSGERLHRQLSIGHPWKELTPFEEREQLEALLYVWGVADSIEGEIACVLGTPRIHEQLNDVVRQYLDAHPPSAKQSGAEVVKLALSTAFPCPLKSPHE